MHAFRTANSRSRRKFPGAVWAVSIPAGLLAGLLITTSLAPATARAQGSADDLLGGGDDLLSGPAPKQSDAPHAKPLEKEENTEASAAHSRLFTENKFPSATTCAVCHPDQFKEWSVSPHAYAQMSPVFNAMQATITAATSGTNGDFCIRCHTQVGMQVKEAVFMSNLDRTPTAREGITCIVCHRVSKAYGKVSGRTSIVEGDLFAPVYGPRDDTLLKEVLAQPGKYKVVTSPDQNGRRIHTEAFKFDTISTSAFCGICHDVNLLNGFRLEEAFSQFKNTPAAHNGTTCQDCHMGKTPGVKSGYAMGPTAIIGGVPGPVAKRTNHMFIGPDYSIVHLGLYPHNTKAQELATLAEWLTFDVDAGWGTDKFENHVPAGYEFPQRWKSIDDRYDARAILDDQIKLVAEAERQRVQILRRGFQLHDFEVTRNDSKGLAFRVNVANGTDGHGTPTGFDAERMLFLEVTVKDANGNVVFKSGDRDPNGDVRDDHSDYVHDWKLPRDEQLFSLQSQFLTRNIRGGEREQVLAVNYSVDPLPFIRPETRSHVLTGRTSGARKQARLLPPLGSRWADYSVPASALTGPGPYAVRVRLISQMVPVNLVEAIEGVGFDYHLSPREVARRVVEGGSTLWDKTVEIGPKGEHLDWKPTEDEILAAPLPHEKVPRDPAPAKGADNHVAMNE